MLSKSTGKPTIHPRQTLLSALRKFYAYNLAEKEWDGWNFRVYSPLSVDDEAEIVVHLKNKGGKLIAVRARFTIEGIQVTRIDPCAKR